MPQLSAIPDTIWDTILHHLAQLFMMATAGNEALARQAAAGMLAAYRVETEEELTLAAEIVSFRLHALEALGHAAQPDLSLNKILRLRGGAVSLSREAHKSQRKLDRLQQDRRAGLTPQPVETQPHPKIEKALAAIEAARPATQSVTQTQPQAQPKIVLSKDYQKSTMLQRMAENARKNRDAYLNSQVSASASTPTPS